MDVSEIPTASKQGDVQCARQQFQELLALRSDRIAVLACTELALLNVCGDTEPDNAIDMNVCVSDAIVQAAHKRFTRTEKDREQKMFAF